MKLHILSRSAAHQFVKERPDVPIIVIKESDKPKSVVQDILDIAKDSLYMVFDDIEMDRKSSRVISPSKQDVEQVLKWSKNKNEIAVACQLGISRSSAIAYIIACSRTIPQDALQYLQKGVHSPNQLIVRLGADALDNQEAYYALMRWVYGSGSVNKFV